MTEARKPSETPYLHIRETEGALFPSAVEITGNAKALLQLREQIDRALGSVAGRRLTYSELTRSDTAN